MTKQIQYEYVEVPLWGRKNQNQRRVGHLWKTRRPTRRRTRALEDAQAAGEGEVK